MFKTSVLDFVKENSYYPKMREIYQVLKLGLLFRVNYVLILLTCYFLYEIQDIFMAFFLPGKIYINSNYLSKIRPRTK